MRLIAGLLLLVAGVVHAQVPTVFQGEKVTFIWTQDPVCNNGAPIAECPITGYHVQVEREAVLDSWSNVSASPLGPTVRTYIWTANGVGQTCFRIQPLNSNGYEQSAPSNENCWKVLVPLKPGAKPPLLSSSKG